MVVAAYANDILKLGFKAAGLEYNGSPYIDVKRGIPGAFPANMPWSHGLFMSVVWALLAAGIAYLIYRDRQAASAVGFVVICHWLLDFIVHPPELPLLFNGSPMVGLGLWNTTPGFVVSIFLEVAMLAGGLVIYLNHRRRRAALDSQKSG
jgi:hypothetical protein